MPKANQPGCACCIPPCTSRALRVSVVDSCLFEVGDSFTVRYQGPEGEDVTHTVTFSSRAFSYVDTLADPSVGEWTITVTMANRHTAVAVAVYDGTRCNADASIRLCPINATALYVVEGCGVFPQGRIRIEGATVTLTSADRGALGSATTDADGIAEVPFEVRPDGCGQLPGEAGTVSVAPPTGLGFTSFSATETIFDCGMLFRTLDLEPDADHVCYCACGWPWPKVLTYSDLYGSCVLVYDPDLGYWAGTYTMDCEGIPLNPGCPPYGTGDFYEKKTVTIEVEIHVGCSQSSGFGPANQPFVTRLVPVFTGRSGGIFGTDGDFFCDGSRIGTVLQSGSAHRAILPGTDYSLSCPESGGLSLTGVVDDSYNVFGLPCNTGPFTVTA